jgi:hypothetical protein
LTAWPSRFRGSLRAGTSRSRSVRTQLGAPLLNRSVIWETDCPTAVLHRHPLAFGREFPWSLSTGPSHRPQGPQLSHCSRTTTPDAPCHGTVTSRPLASHEGLRTMANEPTPLIVRGTCLSPTGFRVTKRSSACSAAIRDPMSRMHACAPRISAGP